MTQIQALTLLKMGKNVFITGPAGSGKTYVVNEYIRFLKERGVPAGVTASTGIAATHLGGMTIHSWAGMGINDHMNECDLEKLSEKTNIAKRLQAAKVLIIDEVSMLHHFRLDMLDKILRHIRGKAKPVGGFKDRFPEDLKTKPFGGLQIVLCGDFFQLPPVSRYSEPDSQFIYKAMAWRDGGFCVCYLSEQFRQKDDAILSILNEIRSGEVSNVAREGLKSRYIGILNGSEEVDGPVVQLKSDELNDEDMNDDLNCAVSNLSSREGSPDFAEAKRRQTKGEAPSGEKKFETTVAANIKTKTEIIEPTRLFTHNVDVDSINNRELTKLQGVESTYEMKSRGKHSLVAALKKSCLAPDKLRLKKGARVMCVKNNFEKGYVNGTLGVVVSCGYGVDPVIRTASGKLLTIEPATWSIDDDNKVLAEIEQYPLRLAWAITVHKSQGMSLDAVEIDLSKSFEPGMGYVALSRARTMTGLAILGLNENALKVHPEVLEYDRYLRESSVKAENFLAYTDTKDIIGAQEEFLARVAPLHYIKGSGKRIKPPKPPGYHRRKRLSVK